MTASPDSAEKPQQAGSRRAVRRRRPVRELVLMLVELVAICGFAVTQPLLDITGRSPEMFTYHRVDRSDMVLYVLAVTALIPLLMWLAVAVGYAVRPVVGRSLHLLLLCAMAVVLAVEVGKKVSHVRGAVLSVVALVVGAGFVALLVRVPAMRTWLRYAAVAPVVFALLFVSSSPAGTLIVGSHKAHAATAAPKAPVPVVVIFLDEFPEATLLDHTGHIDAQLYPNFARLAGDATWFRNATGVSGYTPYAVPAMLSGKMPTKAKAPSYQLYPDTLFSLLSRSYDVRAFETITQLCAPTVCGAQPVPATSSDSKRTTGLYPVLRTAASLGKQLALPRDSKTDVTAEFTDPSGANPDEGAAPSSSKAPPSSPNFGFSALGANQPKRLSDFVTSLDKPGRDGRPTLNFLHLLFPHSPWRYLPDGQTYPFPSENFTLYPQPTGRTFSTTSELQMQRLMLQTAYTDKLLGKVLDTLKKSGAYDKSLVLVTADHGVGLAPGSPGRKMTPSNAWSLGWVPLFVKKPHSPGGSIDDRNVQQVDVLATVADVVGVDIPWKIDGMSAFGSRTRAPEDKTFTSEIGHSMHPNVAANFPKVLGGFVDKVSAGSGGVDRLFQVGPRADLVGHPVSGLPTGPASAVKISFDRRVHPRHVDDPTIGVPALLWGKASGSSRPTMLAFAVNGVIGAVMPTYGAHAGLFAAMVSPKLFRKGANDVAVYEVTGAGSTTTLHQVTVGG